MDLRSLLQLLGLVLLLRPTVYAQSPVIINQLSPSSGSLAGGTRWVGLVRFALFTHLRTRSLAIPVTSSSDACPLAPPPGWPSLVRGSSLTDTLARMSCLWAPTHAMSFSSSHQTLWWVWGLWHSLCGGCGSGGASVRKYMLLALCASPCRLYLTPSLAPASGSFTDPPRCSLVSSPPPPPVRSRARPPWVWPARTRSLSLRQMGTAG